MFKEFYDKTKNIDATEYVNSAKASLNSFSSLLEKRRQQARAALKKEKKVEERQDNASATTAEPGNE